MIIPILTVTVYSNSYLFIHSAHLSAMAGNIIPAIATTNAVIAGLIVMEALKVLAGEFDKCKTVSLKNLSYVLLYFASTIVSH